MFYFIPSVLLIIVTVQCTSSVDIVFDLDASGSITDPYFDLMTRFMMSVVSNLNIITQAGQTGAQVPCPSGPPLQQKPNK